MFFIFTTLGAVNIEVLRATYAAQHGENAARYAQYCLQITEVKV